METTTARRTLDHEVAAMEAIAMRRILDHKIMTTQTIVRLETLDKDRPRLALAPLGAV
jgi:hypothetical protein